MENYNLTQTGAQVQAILNQAPITKELAEQNASDIATLKDLYEALVGNRVVIGDLPAEGEEDTIYRVPGTNSYSDYMWDGTQFVLLATYNNAIDAEPTEDSQNLVTSGGVFALAGDEGFLCRVLAQALAQQQAEIDGLKAQLASMGDAVARTVDVSEDYLICGEELITLGEGAPTTYPVSKKQIYFDTTNSVLYVAVAVTGSTSNWHAVNA